MSIWWNSLTSLEQLFAGIAIPATVILALQTLTLLFGLGGGHADWDGDHDGGGELFDSSDSHDGDTHDGDVFDAGLRIFTIRGFVAFFSIFGWSGIVFLKAGLSAAPTLAISFVLGSLSMVFIAAALAFFLRLQSSGTAEISSALGVTGSVYITIPPRRSGSGKVTALVAGRLSEFDAVTDEKTAIPTGTSVVVTAITGSNTLVVHVK